MDIHADPFYTQTGYDVISCFWSAFLEILEASDGFVSNFSGAARFACFTNWEEFRVSRTRSWPTETRNTTISKSHQLVGFYRWFLGEAPLGGVFAYSDRSVCLTSVCRVVDCGKTV